MKKQTTIFLTIIALIGIIIASYLMISPLLKPRVNDGVIVGGDKDSHGCIPSAGFLWCEEKGKCIRPWEEACKGEDCKNISLDNCENAGCMICSPCKECNTITCNSKEFCNNISSNITSNDSIKNNEKIYCKEEQKNADFCPEYYSETCGWFNSSIKCLKYPCAQEFSNPCFACANPSVEYYTLGNCPK